ncbi:MAG: DUF3857 domain-containing protein [Bacteroidota bacterium]
MRFLFSLLVIAIFPFILTAQVVDEWGKVSPYYLKMTTYEKDTTAEAVIIFDVGDIAVSYDNGQYIFQHHRRIKLLKESSLSRGTIKIPYYTGNNLEILRNIRAQAITSEGKKIPLSKKDFYREKNQEGYSYMNFAIPNLSPGTIIEYKYEINSKDVVELREWYFQHDIPVIYSRLEMTTPVLLPYIYLFQGSEYLTKMEDGSYRFHEDGRLKVEPGFYEMWHAPAVKEEAYMTSYNDYRARIRFQLEKVLGRTNTAYKEEYYVKQEMLSSWENLAKKLEELPLFGQQYLKKRNYKDLSAFLAPMLTDAKNQKEKAKIIYDYLANNIELNRAYGIFAEEQVDKLFEKKAASKGGINLMLLAMLKSLDIPAYPVLTSTRAHGKLLPEHAIFDQFNYLMVQAVLDGKPVLLDVGNALRPMGYPAVQALNYKAWVMNGERSRWINLKLPSTTDVFGVSCSFEEGVLKGKVETKHSGYSAMNERQSYIANEDGRYWEERIAESLQLNTFAVKNKDAIQEDFYNEFEFELEDQVIENEDLIYISPVIYSNFKENPFKAEKRYSNIDYPYQFLDQYIFELEIPEGYRIEQLPELTNLVLPNSGGSFQYMVMESAGKIKISSTIRLKQTQFLPTEYPAIKTMYDLIIEKHGEQIVLKKVADENE